jgi:hypothetical protein
MINPERQLRSLLNVFAQSIPLGRLSFHLLCPSGPDLIGTKQTGIKICHEFTK